MGRIKSQTAYTEKELRYIYALILSEKELYIDYCSSEGSKDVYKRHYQKKNYKTAQAVGTVIDQGDRPCMIKLDEGSFTRVEAYNNVIVWIRYFIDRGYNVIAPLQSIEYSKALNQENEALYQKNINIKSINQVIVCENCLVDSFKKIPCSLKGGIKK